MPFVAVDLSYTQSYSLKSLKNRSKFRQKSKGSLYVEFQLLPRVNFEFRSAQKMIALTNKQSYLSKIFQSSISVTESEFSSLRWIFFSYQKNDSIPVKTKSVVAVLFQLQLPTLTLGKSNRQCLFQLWSDFKAKFHMPSVTKEKFVEPNILKFWRCFIWWCCLKIGPLF